MIKRMISTCLVICMLFAFMPIQVYAESEVTYGYVNVTIWSEHPMKTKPYVALLKNDVIYMSIENLAEIAGYEVEKEILSIFLKKVKKIMVLR